MSILYVRDKDGQFTQIPIFAAPDSGGNVENGEDGFSPIAKVEQTATGAVISITDKDGITTATITNGKDGKDGADGQPGKDGYTPQKNVDYFDGKDGKDGNPGSPGADGSDGITPHIGSNGNWFIGNTDTGKPSRGADGQPGQSGSPGKDGSDGVSATHSWNGTVLTITSASGTSSADLKGAKGDKGDKGDTGAQGIQGIQGIQGEPGAKGDTGAKGDKGDKGDTGAPGADGKDGKDGADGKDGTSATHSWNGTVLTITSASGTSSADLKGEPGRDGSDGKNGSAGADGVSPTVAVSKSGKVTTVSITDKNGTKTATINDGADGSPGSAGKDGTSVTHTWSGTTLTVTSASGTSSADLKGAKGDKGDTGDTGPGGKTAYQYAQDGGYTGTEAEFAEKLANEYNPNPLYGKKVSFLGDSICTGNSDSGTLGGYGKIIADRNNMVYENLAKGGSTITAETYSSSTGTAKGWLCRMVDSMSSDADYAIVEGGYNDAWQYIDHGTIEIGKISNGYNEVLDDTTYYGAFESMLKQLVTKFQGKKIGYIAVPKIMSLYDSNRNAPNFYHIALECCAKWGVPVCDLNTVIPPFEYLKTLGTVYTADGSHPTYEGYIKYYCDPIEAWMKTLTTGGSLPTGTLPTDLDDKYVQKNDVSIKKAQLTLEDGSTVLIDVVVASDGTTISKYRNLVPSSINADGSIYNGTGYKDGYRLSSSGEEKAAQNSTVVGYIPASAGDVIRLGGQKWWASGTGMNYCCAYDSDFTFIGSVYGAEGRNYSTKIHSNIEYGDEITTITLGDVSNIAYIRVNWANGTTITGADVILTINEEITE